LLKTAQELNKKPKDGFKSITILVTAIPETFERVA